MKKLNLLITILYFLFSICCLFAGNIDVMSDGSKYSYGENTGWCGWKTTYSEITVSTGYLSGYLWQENVGWVCLGSTPTNGVSYTNTSETDYGINRNQATGVLSGYGWSENAGWLNFNPTHGGVTISTSGIFGSTGTWILGGWAWGENIGWVCFSSSNYRVRTSALPSPPVPGASALGYSSIKWMWSDNSSGWSQENGFRVYTSTGGLIAATSADVIDYTETGLNRNKPYSRYVQPYNVAWSSSASNSTTVSWRTKPGTYQEKTVVRTPPNSFGFVGDGLWEWEVAAKSGQLVTITAYIRYNSSYGAAGKPKLTLYNLGVNSNATMSASADTWEQLQVSGTPNRNGVLKLKIEGFSTIPGAKMFVDDISISQ
ncbi:MAG: hypothetical protein WC947_07325 [Elusimicrobiota bacterium]